MSTPTHDPNGLPPMHEYAAAHRAIDEHEQRRQSEIYGVDVAADGSGAIVSGRLNADGSVTIDTVEQLDRPPQLTLVVTMQGYGVVGTATNDNGTLTLTITDPTASAVLRGATAPLSVSLEP